VVLGVRNKKLRFSERLMSERKLDLSDLLERKIKRKIKKHLPA
jgi:hypothetical protein